MNKIKKFFRILSLFIFCIRMIYTGQHLKINEPCSFMELWNYCKKWEEGQL